MDLCTCARHSGPVHTYPNMLENGDFFLRERRFRLQIRRFLKTLLQIVKNGDLSYSYGRSKTKVFKYDDVKIRVQ